MKHRKPRRADWRKKPAKWKIVGRGFVFTLHTSPNPVKQLPFLKILSELGFQLPEGTTEADAYTHACTVPTRGT